MIFQYCRLSTIRIYSMPVSVWKKRSFYLWTPNAPPRKNSSRGASQHIIIRSDFKFVIFWCLSRCTILTLLSRREVRVQEVKKMLHILIHIPNLENINVHNLKILISTFRWCVLWTNNYTSKLKIPNSFLLYQLSCLNTRQWSLKKWIYIYIYNDSKLICNKTLFH